MENKIIKSALEIALERSKKVEVSREELEMMEYEKTGKKIAGQFISEKKFNLQNALKQFKDSARKYITEVILNVLLLNIVLPRDKESIKEIRKILEGITILKKNKNEILKISADIEELMHNYRKVVDENYKRFKKQYQSQYDETRKLVEDQTGLKVKIEVESDPEFQKQWKEILTNIDSQFNDILNQHKTHIKTIP